MSDTDLETKPACNADDIFAALSQKQFLRPHRRLDHVLAEIGICPLVVSQTVEWLELDLSRAVGRLRASELMQLSRCLHRLREQAISDASRIPQTT